MSDPGRRSEERELFDLPLTVPGREARREDPAADEPPGTPSQEAASEDAERPPPRRARGRSRPASLPLFPDLEEAPPRRPRPTAVPAARREALEESPQGARRLFAEDVDEDVAEDWDEGVAGDETVSAAAGPVPRLAPLGRRWLAGGLDLGVHLLLAAVLVGGSMLMGARVEGAETAALGAFLVVFSLLYTAIPLAFWGQTPGMWRARIVSRGEEHGGLTFGQTALRWAGGVLTLALAGLPSLLALAGGRSLTDRLSGTWTWEKPVPEP